MFQQNFKNIDDVLWKQAGGSPGLDHIKQSISMLFLNGIDDLEEQKAMESGLMDWNHEFTIRPCFQGAFWSLPEKAECETAFEWSEELV